MGAFSAVAVVTVLNKSKYQTISVTPKGLVRLILNWSIKMEERSLSYTKTSNIFYVDLLE